MTKWEYIRKISACGDRYGNNGGIFDLLRWCGKTNTLEVTEEEARDFLSLVSSENKAAVLQKAKNGLPT